MSDIKVVGFMKGLKVPGKSPLHFEKGSVHRMSSVAFDLIRSEAPDSVLDLTPKDSMLAVHGIMMKAKLPPAIRVEVPQPERVIPSHPGLGVEKHDFWHILASFRAAILRLIGK
jgi:hypothetical protein